MGKKKQPETSTAAYKSLDPDHLNDTYKNILWALGEIGEGHFEDIAKKCGANASTIWKRLSELAVAGLIYRPGNKKKLKSGREGYTWMLTGAVTKEMQNREKVLGGKSVADHSREITTIVREHKRKKAKLPETTYTNKLF